MAHLLCVPLQINIHPSHQASVRGKGWFPSPAGKATSWVPLQNKRKSPLPILCSVGGNETATTVVPESKVFPAAQVDVKRSHFPPPPDFVFGAASSAYQVEGAWNEGGRGPSIWDTFTHEQIDKIDDKSTGDLATDSYNRYKEDVKIMKDMGMDSYRFSISWSRILPDGTLKGGVNQEGIAYYNNLINELINNGIKPFVTLFHWDVPQALEDKYGGFRDRRIVDDFKDYAKTCFLHFGDRVKHWITLNEPWTFSVFGYSLGWHAPGRCSQPICSTGDSKEEPYNVTHNLILAHATVARLYKDHFQAIQKGEVGITLVSLWYMPYSNSYQDKAAAERAMDFMLGWYMEPLVYGDYPFIMRALVRNRLPNFTEEDMKMIKGSYDFIGINYYTSKYARAKPIGKQSQFSTVFDDICAELAVEKDGVEIGDKQGSWIYVVPEGIKALLKYTKERYEDPKIYITENGTCEIDNPEWTMEQACNDQGRIDYFCPHLAEVRAAIQEGVKVKGHFAWSLTDNFEWQKGYKERFGLIYIDYAQGLKRSPKKSAEWYTGFLKS